MNRIALIVIVLIVVTACLPSSPRSITAQQNLNSAQVQATNAAIDDASVAYATKQAREDHAAAEARATNIAYSATTQAINATRTANDATIAALSVEQQANNATTQARQNESAIAISINAATATAQAIDRVARLDIDNATRAAAEVHATSTAVAVAASDDQGRRIKSDWYYILPDVLMRYAPCGAVLVALFLALYVGRSIAARIAGDSERAELALSNSILTVNFPYPLLPAPREAFEGNSEETENTETQGNSGNTAVSQEETLLNVRDNGVPTPMLPMSREEALELRNVRHDAIALLDRCIAYFRNNHLTDDGTIPRYDKISIKAEDRQEIVDNLWYSGYVSKTKNRTFVESELLLKMEVGNTCAGLLKMITDQKVRVYPLGYSERKQKRLDEAVAALPGIER